MRPRALVSFWNSYFIFRTKLKWSSSGRDGSYLQLKTETRLQKDQKEFTNELKVRNTHTHTPWSHHWRYCNLMSAVLAKGEPCKGPQGPLFSREQINSFLGKENHKEMAILLLFQRLNNAFDPASKFKHSDKVFWVILLTTAVTLTQGGLN